MNNETMQARAARLVQNEVHLCLSSLVHTLANSAFTAVNGQARELIELTEQAFELACPIPDYEEEAASENGWHTDEDGLWFRAPLDGDKQDALRVTAEDAASACDLDAIEPYDREAFEHWAVSTWLAEKLIEHGEKVDTDFAGMNVWARTTTGQGIAMDAVVQAIAAELLQPEATA